MEEPIKSKFLRPSEVEKLTSLSAVTLWRLRSRGEFPQSVQLSPGRVGYLASDVDAWMTARAGVQEVPPPVPAATTAFGSVYQSCRRCGMSDRDAMIAASIATSHLIDFSEGATH